MTSLAVERVLREVRAAVRNLRRAPSFTITTILILGLGIGIATAMFTVFAAVLLRPLPLLAPDRVVLPHTVDARGIDLALTLNEFKQLRVESRTLSGIAGEAHQGAFGTTLLDGDRTLDLRVAWVTGNFFDVLGARPTLGRLFHTEDESLGEPSSIVITYETWQKRFGRDPGVVGRRLTSPYSQHAATIVGVGPAGLDYPRGVEYWSPTVYGGGLNVVGRLAPGTAPAAAQAEFAAIMGRLFRQRPNSAELAGIQIRTLPQAALGSVKPVLLALSVAVALLLLIACVNVGLLLLLRLSQRKHEIAIRYSLGADTVDILRQLFAESGILALGGGLCGAGLSAVLVRLVVAVAPTSLPRLDVIQVQTAPNIASGVTLIVVILIGVLPALMTVQSDLASPLRADDRSGRGGRGRHHLRRVLVSLQTAIALVLLAGAGLLARSLERLERLDLGYRADHLSVLTVAVPVTLGNASAKFATALDVVPPALRALPGVTAITPIEIPPFFGPQVFNARWEVEGHASANAEDVPRLPVETGGVDYFRTFEIPLLRGRGFLESDRDSALHVAVVSEGAARALALGADPIGRRIRVAGDTSGNAWRTVVGLAGDIHYRTLKASTPSIYVPARQWFFQGVFAVRTVGSLSDLLPAIRRATSEAYAGATLVRSETMDDLLGNQLALPRLSALLLTGFSVAALLLAALGLYAVVASTVRERTHEFGVRAVLGATPGQLRRNVLGEALLLSGLGGAMGMIAAMLVTRFLTSLLFETSPLDPITFLGTCVILLSVALVTAIVPAHRATQIDPAMALRAE